MTEENMTLKINKRNKIKMLILMLVVGIIGTGIVNISSAEILKKGTYPGNSFIDPTVVIDTSNFSIGTESYMAPYTRFVGEYFSIGNYANVQDSGDDRGKIIISNGAVVAHGADLVGNVKIEEEAFIGFNSIIQDSIIGEGAYIGVGSKIIGVEIPAYKSVDPGTIIDSEDKVKYLPDVTKEQEEFVKEVVEVNRALAVGYSKLYNTNGMDAFKSVGPNGDGDILIEGKDILDRNGSGKSVIGEGTTYYNVRIIGNVSIGDNGKIGNRTSIRGDEGVPIIIGKNAVIGEDNTFHSLDGKEIKIGDRFSLGNDAVVHGPLEIGDGVSVGSRAVVFKSKIGNNVTIGDKAIVIGVEVPNGVIITASSIVTDKVGLDKIIGKTVTITDKEPVETTIPSTTSAKKTPGFEGIMVIVGLFSIYMLRRK